MKTPVDARLTLESTSVALRFACDDCVHFAVERERTCGNGWPIPLRRSALQGARTTAEPSSVSFCKEFELA